MFVDVSHLIQPNPPMLGYGAAVGRWSEYGPELFVAGYGEANRLFRWSGKDLRDVTPPELADDDRMTLSAAAGDANGDGREELYVLNADTYAGPKTYADRLWQLDTAGHWSDLFGNPQNKPLRNYSSGRSVAAIDRRGTGRYGFFVANYARPMRLYELGQEGRLVDVAPSLDLNATTGGRGLWVGPLVSERTDLLCINEQGSNFLFRNTGMGTFLEIASAVNIADVHENGRGVAVFDANDDGFLDIAYGNWDGPNRLMIRTNDGAFRDRATPAMALPGAVRTVLAADFDNDGYEELFFHYHNESNRLFKYRPEERGRGSWQMTDLGSASLPNGRGTAGVVADIDNDGILELLLVHGESLKQPLSLFKNLDAGKNKWVRFEPRSRLGAPARGATVKLFANSRTYIRVIDGGSGYLCQMEPVAHFGLGDVEEIDEVRVTWPDGAVAILNDVPVCHTIVVPYPGR